MKEDKLILGGHEFTSRFILGSGKVSLELVQACIEQAGAQIITLALRRANEGGLANILDYIPEGITSAAQHVGSTKRRGGGADRSPFQRTGVRGFRQGGGDQGFTLSAAGQSGNHQDDGDPCQRRLCGHAIHVS